MNNIDTIQNDLFIHSRLLNGIINTIPCALCVIDREKNIIGWNNAATELTGYSHEEIIGMNCMFFADLPCSHSCDLFSDIIEKPLKKKECLIRTKDGELRIIKKNIDALKNSYGEIIAGIESFYDITEVREMEKKLLQSKNKFKGSFEHSHIPMAIINSSGNFLDVNDAVSKLFGYSISDLKNKSFFDITHPQEIIDSKIQYSKLINGDLDFYEQENRYLHRDGHIIQGVLNISAVKDEHGILQYSIAQIIDKSKEKKVEFEHQKVLKKFQALFYKNVDMLYIHDLKNDGSPGNFIEVNESLCNTLGYTQEEIKRLSPVDIIKNNELFKEDQIKQGINQNPDYLFEQNMVSKDGREIPVEIHGSKFILEEKPVVIGIARDITQRKRNEHLLKDNEEKYRTYINNAPVGIFICDEHGQYLEVNDAATKVTGFTKEELLNMSINDITAENSRAIALSYFKQLQETGEFSGCTQFNHKNGSIHWWRINAVKISQNRFLGFTQDITKQKQIEYSLKKSEEKLQSIFENKGTAVGIFGDDGIITTCNSKFEELSGYTKDEIINRMKWSDFVSSEDLEVMKKYHQSRSQGMTAPNEYECSLIKKNGEKKSLIINIEVIPNTKERIVSLTDITKQKKAEEKLSQLNKNLENQVKERTKEIQYLLQQKDDFINQLGHDLKNPLSPFIQLLPILKNHVKTEEDKKIIEVLERNSQYMRKMVKKTIAIAKLNSRKTQFNFEQVNLLNIVNRVIDLNQQLFDEKGILIDNKITENITVNVDELYIEEVFTNLFSNAVKYSNGVGKITVDCEIKANQILVSVQDRGIGISSEHINHLFDEYYKVDHSRHDFDSNGLGLPICKRIINRHGGRIWAESKGLEQGSTFYFTLPK